MRDWLSSQGFTVNQLKTMHGLLFSNQGGSKSKGVLTQSLVASNDKARTILGYTDLVSHENLFSLAKELGLQRQHLPPGVDLRQGTIDMILNLLADPVPQPQQLLIPTPPQGAMVSFTAAQPQPLQQQPSPPVFTIGGIAHQWTFNDFSLCQALNSVFPDFTDKRRPNVQSFLDGYGITTRQLLGQALVAKSKEHNGPAQVRSFLMSDPWKLDENSAAHFYRQATS